MICTHSTLLTLAWASGQVLMSNPVIHVLAANNLYNSQYKQRKIQDCTKCKIELQHYTIRGHPGVEFTDHCRVVVILG